MNHKKSLVILAAGMGSRYGGLKQMDGVGPSGESILEYSVFDALRAGFTKIVFIIRKEFEREFHERIGARFVERAQICYAFQDINDLPAPHSCPAGREKPWGTGHALLATRGIVQEHFCVINADDFYGRAAYEMAARDIEAAAARQHGSIIAFTLGETLSEHGTVSRGACTANPDGTLKDIEEVTAIQVLEGKLVGNSTMPLSLGMPVSMNMWTFSPDIIEAFQAGFKDFLAVQGQELKSEFYIPKHVGTLVQSGALRVKLSQTDSQWFGITYREDREMVVERLLRLCQAGEYPFDLHR